MEETSLYAFVSSKRVSQYDANNEEEFSNYHMTMEHLFASFSGAKSMEKSADGICS